MPLDSYARRIAVDLTGRASWSAERGPEAYAGRQPVELLADIMFAPASLWDRPLITVDRRPMKKMVGLDEERRFFTAAELMQCAPAHDLIAVYEQRREKNPKARPSKDEQAAMDAIGSAMQIAKFQTRIGTTFAIVVQPDDLPLAGVSMTGADPGAEHAQAAFVALGEAYFNGENIAPAVEALRTAIESKGTLDAGQTRRLELEVFGSTHKPFLKAAVAALLALLALGLGWMTGLRKVFGVVAAIFIVWCVAEQLLGLWLRVSVLQRAPVSNTYEALLWMGLVGIGIGLVGQLINRKSWYLAAGLGASVLSILFANLVPLDSQTNAMPAVLRSNYWLIIHVMTIVASYGALLLAALLGHLYLIHDILLGRSDKHQFGRSPRLIIQTYRVIQLGLILLTAGTILGGVWAAESWGRFWGWDPKETWSLISIVVYFAMLHARYVGWLKDFGLAVASIIGFMAIVWTFYGVNYVMASGLHSYGFGSGGEKWVATWAILEFVFLAVCFIRMKSTRPPDKDNSTDKRSQGPVGRAALGTS